MLLELLTMHPTPADGQALVTTEFEAYIASAFEKKRTISFPDANTLPIGVISTLNVASDGHLVITDEVGNQALLFESDGDLVTRLDARLCNPGVRFFPTGAIIKPDSSVLVLGTSPWGFLFGRDGSCKGSLSTEFTGIGQNELVLDGNHAMIGLYETGVGHVLRFMTGAGRTKRESRLPQSPAPGVDYRWAGGGLAKTEKYLYYATPSSTGLTQLDAVGSPIRVFRTNKSWFRPITGDVPDPFDPNSVDQHMGRIVDNKSMVENVLLLDHDLVMIQYHNGNRGFGLQVFDETGRAVTEILGAMDYFLHASNGLAYRVVQPDANKNGHLPNPHVELYEYTGR